MNITGKNIEETLLPPGVAAYALGVSRQRVQQLIISGVLRTEILYGTRLVCLSSIESRVCGADTKRNVLKTKKLQTIQASGL